MKPTQVRKIAEIIKVKWEGSHGQTTTNYYADYLSFISDIKSNVSFNGFDIQCQQKITITPTTLLGQKRYEDKSKHK